MNLLKQLKNKAVKREIIHEFILDNIPHRVVDYSSWVPGYKNRREIIFKIKDDKKHLFTQVYLQVQNNIFNPFLLCHRKLHISGTKVLQPITFLCLVVQDVLSQGFMPLSILKAKL